LYYTFVADSMRSVFSHLDTIGPKAAEICTHNNGQYAVQGHSRSPILVPVESLYETSY